MTEGSPSTYTGHGLNQQHLKKTKAPSHQINSYRKETVSAQHLTGLKYKNYRYSFFPERAKHFVQGTKVLFCFFFFTRIFYLCFKHILEGARSGSAVKSTNCLTPVLRNMIPSSVCSWTFMRTYLHTDIHTHIFKKKKTMLEISLILNQFICLPQYLG